MKALTQRKNYLPNRLKVEITKNWNLKIQLLIHVDVMLDYCCYSVTQNFDFVRHVSHKYLIPPEFFYSLLIPHKYFYSTCIS